MEAKGALHAATGPQDLRQKIPDKHCHQQADDSKFPNRFDRIAQWIVQSGRILVPWILSKVRFPVAYAPVSILILFDRISGFSTGVWP
jgi:hypothetical protein